MRVGVDGIPLFGKRTGVGIYTKNVVEAASKLSNYIDFEIIRQLMPHRKIHKLPIQPNKHLSYRITRWLPPIIYYQMFKRLGWTLPYDWIARRKYDAILFTNFVAFPVSKRTKSIIVIHDLSYVYHKDYVQTKNLKWLEKRMSKSIENAAHIITISENSKKEIIKHYKVDPDKISIVSNAVDHSMYFPRTDGEIASIRNKYKLPKNYILYTGTLEPRKNIEGILNSYASLPPDLKEKFSLVLAGGKGWKDESIMKRIAELKKNGEKIIQTGYVPDDELPKIFNGADLFVFPSFYEGFGIPPLEAMASGVPVITSNNSSLPEAVGDAALMIDAHDTTDLTRQMEKVLTDEKLSRQLRSKGLSHAKNYNWDNSGRDLLKVLEKVAKN